MGEWSDGTVTTISHRLAASNTNEALITEIKHYKSWIEKLNYSENLINVPRIVCYKGVKVNLASMDACIIQDTFPKQDLKTNNFSWKVENCC